MEVLVLCAVEKGLDGELHESWCLVQILPHLLRELHPHHCCSYKKWKHVSSRLQLHHHKVYILVVYEDYDGGVIAWLLRADVKI